MTTALKIMITAAVVFSTLTVASQATMITWAEGEHSVNDDVTNPGKSYNSVYTVSAQGSNAVAYVAINGEAGTDKGKLEARNSGLLTMWMETSNPTADGYAVVAFQNTGSGVLQSISANIDERFTLTGRDSEYAWFIETGSGTFATGFTVFNNPASDVALANPGAASWFAFDLVNDLGDSTIGGLSNPNLGDIDAVGLFFKFGLDNDSHNGNIGPRINTFSANLAVPEPSSLALIAIGGALLMTNRRRKMVK